MTFLKRSSGSHLLPWGTTSPLVRMRTISQGEAVLSWRQRGWALGAELGPMSSLDRVSDQPEETQPPLQQFPAPVAQSPASYLLESGQIMSFDDMKLELWEI